jgi:hypothetical protein
MAIDGKAERRRLRFPNGGGPVHVLSAFCQRESCCDGTAA